MKRIWFRRMAIAVLCAVLLPYLTSRFASPFRQVQLFTESAVATPIEDAVTNGFRLLTYNIAHGRGLAVSNWDGGHEGTRLERLQKIAGVLRDSNADVIVLNEVDFDCSWSNGVNQAEFLAKEAGYPFRVEQRNLDVRLLWWKWKFGNAILSKYPLSAAQVIDVPGYSLPESLLAGQKRVVCADVQFAGRSIRVLGAHLCHRSESVRSGSAEAMLNVVRSYVGESIIAGDLNSTPEGFPHSINDDGINAIATLDDSERFRRCPAEYL